MPPDRRPVPARHRRVAAGPSPPVGPYGGDVVGHQNLTGPPRSVLLALWLGAIGSGAGPVRHAVRAVESDDEPHTVAGPGSPVPEGTGLDELVALWSGGDRRAAAVLPVPGDVAGLPPEVAAVAIEAGECVLVHHEHRSWAAVPEVVTFGSTLETGHLVTWQVTEVPEWHHLLLGVVGTLSEAERALRLALLEVTEELTALDVAPWGPQVPAALVALRAGDPHWPVPDGLDPRVQRVLVDAVRLRAVVEIATADDGGAVSLGESARRSHALRGLDRAARYAITAATAAAGHP